MACIRHDKKRDRLIIDFYDQHNKRRWITLPKDTTKGDAKRRLREIEDRIDKGIFVTEKKMPVFSDVAKDWLEYKMPNIRKSTYVQYHSHVHNYLIPYFGNTRLSRVNFNSIEKFMAESVQKGINMATLKKIIITLGGIMRYSVRKRYIDYNPVQHIDKPKGQSHAKEKIDYLRKDEIQVLLDAVKKVEKTPQKEIKYRTLYKMAFLTGLRQGEMVGLRWSDLDWHNRQIRVERTFNNSRLYEPKTKRSRRSVNIGEDLINDLKAWRLASSYSDDNDLVFANDVGNHLISQHILRRHFYPTLRRAGLRQIKFHGLRHTYASIMIALGAYPKYIQEQMGHSSINVTMDTYGHLMESGYNNMADKMEKFLSGNPHKSTNVHKRP